MLDSEKESLEFSCSLNLASCRLRAEALARQLHSKLWSLGRFELTDRPCAASCLKSYAASSTSEPIIDRPPKRRQYGANHLNSNSCWQNDEEAMFSSDDEGYEPGDCSSPPSPADEDIVVNPPITMPPVPSSIETSPPMEETEEIPLEACGNKNAILSINQKDNCALDEEDLKYGRILCEKLQKYADRWTEEQQQCVVVPNDIDHHSDNTTQDNIQKCEEIIISPCEDDNAVQPESRFTVVPCDSLQKSLESLKIADSPSSVDNTVSEISKDTSSESLSQEVKRHEKGQLYLNVDDERRPLLRSTSLKTGKTPPGTPRRKKIVRFADALGLDLEAVKHIVTDDVPIVPQSAYIDLKVTAVEQQTTSSIDRTSWVTTQSHAPSYSLYPQFQQPAMSTDFMNRVREQKICLENVVVDDMTVHCVVRVLNICFEKMVYARYTTTEWATCEDVLASYVPGSHDGISDRFSFNIYVPHLTPGQRLVLALRYITGGVEYWDNNRSCNYVLRCCSNSQILPMSQDGQNWLHHFI